MALLGAGMLAEDALDYDDALIQLRKALALFKAMGARAGEGWALMFIGRAARWVIDVDARPAGAWFEDALRICRDIDEPAGIGSTLCHLAEERLKARDLEGAASRAAEALDLGTRSGLLQTVAESRLILAMVAVKRGQHADAERLLAEVAATHEQEGDRRMLALILTMTAHLAFNHGDDIRALGPLQKALRLARDSGSGERIRYAVALAASVLHQRGRAREVATLAGAVEAVYLGRRSGLIQSVFGTSLDALASVASAEFDEDRVAGRSLSLERAADLALRVLDEELAAASAASVPEGDGAAGIANTPRRRGR
jgi:hypothetical protein